MDCTLREDISAAVPLTSLVEELLMRGTRLLRGRIVSMQYLSRTLKLWLLTIKILLIFAWPPKYRHHLHVLMLTERGRVLLHAIFTSRGGVDGRLLFRGQDKLLMLLLQVLLIHFLIYSNQRLN